MRRIAIVGLVSAIVACGGSDPSPALPLGQESEPNDSIATATPLTSGTTAASLGSGTDLDYFSFVVPAGGAVVRARTFDATGVGCAAPLDTYVYIRNSAGTSLASDDNSGPNSCSDVSALLAAGTYYVEVMGASTAYPASYTITLTVTAPAGPYSADALVSGSLTTPTSVDCWAITNPTGAAVTVRLETYVGGLGACYSVAGDDTYLYVYDTNIILQASNDDGGINLCSLLNYSLPAGATRYACVRGYFFSLVPQYQLQIDFP